MKKLLALIMAMVFTLSLVGCSSSENMEDFEKELGDPGTIRVGISPDYKPFEYYDDNGNITGFDYDMVNELMKYIGTEDEPYKVEFIAMDFSTIISSVNSSTVDIGVAAFTYDPE